MKNIDNCPVCGEKFVVTCKCPKRDSACKNGHHWHICLEHKKIVLGESDHSRPTLECSCKIVQSDFIWPTVFDNGIGQEQNDAALCAAALQGWGICMSGNIPHSNFGKTMVDIGKRLNILATPEELTKWAKEHGFLKNLEE